MPPIDPRVQELLDLEKRHSLATTDVATLTNLAASTVRFVECSGRLPVRRLQREALLRFLDRARSAKKRSDLHLEDLDEVTP